MSTDRSALDVLATFHSWQLNRVSPATYPNDVVVTARRQGQPLTDAEGAAVAKWVRSGTCYRCRIGRSRFFFGETALEAAERAAANETANQPTQEINVPETSQAAAPNVLDALREAESMLLVAMGRDLVFDRKTRDEIIAGHPGMVKIRAAIAFAEGGRLDELIGERDRLRAEVDRLKATTHGLVSGLRSHLGDLIRRIGPARRPEDIRAKLEEIHAAYNSWADQSAEAERDRLRAQLAKQATERGQLLAMLERAGIGHGTRVDYNPPGEAVQVENDADDSGQFVTDFWFDESGALKSVHCCQHEEG